MRFASEIEKDLVNQPIMGLKWGGSQQLGANPLTEYLKALVRSFIWEARCHGVGEIEFAWSYPLSLPPRPRGAMRGSGSTES